MNKAKHLSEEPFAGENTATPPAPVENPSRINMPGEPPNGVLPQDRMGQAFDGVEVPAKKAAWYLTAIGLGLVLIITVVAVMYKDDLRDLQGFGYAGAFVISIMSGGTVVVPIPGVPVIIALGGILPFPFLVGLAAGLGEGIGAFNFYLAGRGGQSLITEKHRRNRFFAKVDGWMTRRGGLTLFVASAIPNVLFSVVAATAGLARMSPWKFYLFCAAGKAVKGTYFAYIGFFGLEYALEWLGWTL